MRNGVEEVQQAPTECPSTACILGKSTRLVASFHVVPSEHEKLPREGGCRSST